MRRGCGAGGDRFGSIDRRPLANVRSAGPAHGVALPGPLGFASQNIRPYPAGLGVPEPPQEPVRDVPYPAGMMWVVLLTWQRMGVRVGLPIWASLSCSWWWRMVGGPGSRPDLRTGDACSVVLLPDLSAGSQGCSRHPRLGVLFCPAFARGRGSQDGPPAVRATPQREKGMA
jgi:hypothetical protein